MAEIDIELLEADGELRATRVRAGDSLAEALRSLGYALEFDCGGRGVCGRCVARVGIDGAPLAWVKTCQTRATPGMLVDVSSMRRLGEVARDPYASTRADERTCAAREPTADERRGALGVAVDLGTTTIACALVSLDSRRVLGTCASRNPQLPFGRDVLSRISRAADCRSADQMRSLTTRAIGELVATRLRELGARESQVAELVVAGNTTMEYLFSGLDPTTLGVAPFTLTTSEFPERSGVEFDWGVARLENARVRVFPVVSAFIGGDVLAGWARLRARGVLSDRASSLLLDVGTNGEAVLAANGRYYAASTAAGPAFEGSEISQGSLAEPGAIDAIDYDPSHGDWRAHTLGDVPARSVCGSGLVDAIAGMLRRGALDVSGRLARVDALAVDHSDWRARFSSHGKSRRFLISNFEDGEVWLTQRDIRQAQLAIAAIKAGRSILLEVGGADALATVYLAGGFGASLRSANARRVGLLPEGGSSHYIGNGALWGAVDALTARVDWRELHDLAREIEVVDLTRHNFAEIFANAMRFSET